MEEARSALQALNYRELQARAKALGVRANGKSTDLVEKVAKAMVSGPVNGSDGERARRTGGTRTLGRKGRRIAWAERLG